MEPIDNWVEDQGCRTFMTDTGWVVLAIKSDWAGRPLVKFWGDWFYDVGVPWCALALPCRGVRHVCHVYGFYFGGKLLLNPGIRLASLFVIAVTGRPLPLVVGIKLAGLFEDPAASVSVSS